MNNKKIWYVTGASHGLGLILVKQLLAAGYRTTATSRSAAELQKAVDPADPRNFLPLEVDLTDADDIRRSIEKTVDTFGAIDVVVNNAGYGMEGTVEEVDLLKMEAIFRINVFATVTVVKFAVPYFRNQHSGYIINIASVAGFAGAPGWSIYSATKSAVIAFSEVLALDLEELGIHVTVVAPSNFRTGFLTKDSLVAAESKITAYQSVARTRARYAALDGKQPGDPEKAAALFIRLAEDADPPLHLWLGANAVDRVSRKVTDLAAELQKWKDLSLAADFPDPAR
jgi:short-subunit dehydrogenase